MKLILIYSLIITFYIDQVIGEVDLNNIMRGLSLNNLNVYLLFVLWMISIMKSKRGSILIQNNINKYILLMGFVVFMSIFVKILYAEVPNISIKSEIIIFKQWLDPVLLFFILFNIVDNKETCDGVLLGLCFLILLFILAQLFATYGFLSLNAKRIYNYGRTGGFGAPGEYAITLVLFLPMFLSGILLKNKKSVFRIICMILVPLILVSLINVGSRNGALSLLICMIVFGILLKRYRIFSVTKITLMAIGMLVVGIFSFIVSPDNVKVMVRERFDPINSENINKYTSGRYNTWVNGFRFFMDSPLIGHGQNTYSILNQKKKWKGNTHGVDAHNEYLKHLVEYGIIGLFVFCIIFIKIIKKMLSSIRNTNNSWQRQLYISYVSGLCGYMCGIFATNTGPSLYIFWIYTAIIYKYAFFEQEVNDKNYLTGVRKLYRSIIYHRKNLFN